MTGMGLAKIELDLGVGVPAKVLVNGTDIATSVVGLSLCARAGWIPELRLDLLGEVRLAGEGVVYVKADSDVVLEFLDEVDAEALEAQALGESGFGGPSVGESMLEVLKEMARGDHDRT